MGQGPQGTLDANQLLLQATEISLMLAEVGQGTHASYPSRAWRNPARYKLKAQVQFYDGVPVG